MNLRENSQIKWIFWGRNLNVIRKNDVEIDEEVIVLYWAGGNVSSFCFLLKLRRGEGEIRAKKL